MWEDLLEALAVGGSGAISGYMQAQEANAARAERERERQAMEAYREATMAMDRERLEIARATADEAERKDIERRMGSGELRVAREIPNLAAARSTIAEALKAGEGPEDMFEGAGLGMAAKPAAGQTYAAQMQREKEQERTDVGRTPMSFLDEIPEFEPSETFQEAGSREFEGQALRPTTPAERAAAERERKDLERGELSELLSRALAGDEEAITEVYASDLGKVLEDLRSFREPEVEVLEEPEKLRLFRSLRGELGDEAAYRAAFGEELGGEPPTGGGGGRGGGGGGGMDPATIRSIIGEVNDIVSKGRTFVDEDYQTMTVPYTKEEIDDIVAQQLELYGVVSGEDRLEPIRKTILESVTSGLLDPRPRVQVPLRPDALATQGAGGLQPTPMSEADMFLQRYGGGQ